VYVAVAALRHSSRLASQKGSNNSFSKRTMASAMSRHWDPGSVLDRGPIQIGQNVVHCLVWGLSTAVKPIANMRRLASQYIVQRFR
jgi:hypothetical protein